MELEVKLIWSGINQPYPKEISQRDMEQKFEYFGNAHFYSPYPTTTQKLIVKYVLFMLKSKLTSLLAFLLRVNLLAGKRVLLKLNPFQDLALLLPMVHILMLKLYQFYQYISITLIVMCLWLLKSILNQSVSLIGLQSCTLKKILNSFTEEPSKY